MPDIQFTFLKKLLTLFLILTVTQSAQAKPEESNLTPEGAVSAKGLYIVLDQAGIEKKFPIAVTDMEVFLKNDKEALSTKVAEILKNDLKIAGFFEVLSKSKYPENPGPSENATDINFNNWKNIGAQALVKSTLNEDSKNYIFEFRLFDPINGQLLVGKRYKVEKKNYRPAIHRFMDEIMLALTGEKGIFSTKIVAACGKPGQRDLYLMDIDGENRLAVTKEKTINISPDWSPDGLSFAYTSYSKYFPEIFITPTVYDKKNKPKRITFNNSMNLTPVFSPDGSQIALSSNMSGDFEIYLMDKQGNNVARLTQSSGIDTAPSFSPDGQKIVFVSDRSGGAQLFVMNKDGSQTKRLTFEGTMNDQPNWSPKGDRIAFVRRENGLFNIFSINPDGSGLERLSNGPGSNESPSFSPDGRYLVFSRTQNYKNDLYIMLWQGSNVTRITNLAECVNPDWSPWYE